MIAGPGLIDRRKNLIDLDVAASLGLGGFKLGNGGLDPVLDLDIAGLLGLHDLESDGGAAIEAGKTALLGGAVANLGNIGQTHIAPLSRDHQVADLVNRACCPQDPQGLFAAADLGAATGHIDIEHAQGLIHRIGGQAIGAKALGIENDIDFAIDAANPRDLGHALFALQCPGHSIIDKPAELRLGHTRGGDGIG